MAPHRLSLSPLLINDVDARPATSHHQNAEHAVHFSAVTSDKKQLTFI